MSDVTNFPYAREQGDSGAASQLLPLVYDELRMLAAQKLAQEQPGQTLQPTALVHQAYLRLVALPPHAGSEEAPWDSRGHFFAAMAEAMRRILVENARRRSRVKHGGGRQRVDLDDQDPNFPVRAPAGEIIALDDALNKLAEDDPIAAQVVKLHFFGGLSIEQAAAALGMSAQRPTGNGATLGRGSGARSATKVTPRRREFWDVAARHSDWIVSLKGRRNRAQGETLGFQEAGAVVGIANHAG